MKNTIKSIIYEVKVSQQNLHLRDFETILQELSSNLDDNDSKNTRILDRNTNNIETSIWFDSFDDIARFTKENIFNDTICFLLAKDMNFQLIEDKDENRIKNMSTSLKQKPKIPAHCVYIKNKNILLIEESTNSPSIFTLKRGTINNVTMLKKDDVDFKPKYRDNLIDRLNLFVDNIKSVELIDLNIEKYLKEKEDDGYMYNFLQNPNTKLSAKLQIESDDWRTKVVNYFADTINNRATRELNNIKVSYKDEKENDDILSLYNNLVYLKVEKDIYHEDISNLEMLDRIEYSKNIYKTMIEAYNDI